jgi:fructokinase
VSAIIDGENKGGFTMQKEFDVIALGELLIDFTMHGESEQGNNLFEACPGGAPCNVLAMLNKLGKKTAFLGKVGQDQFGTLLKATLDDVGIDTCALYMDQEVNTTLAFVHTFPDGDREFSFYRNPGADMMLTADEVDEEFVKKAKIFHFGTLSMTHDGVREATKKALKIAKDNGLVITFDPNLRPPLWSSLELAKEQMEYGFAYCDVLKISDNEIQFISGKEDYDEGIRYLQEKYQIPLILLTMGKDGSRAYYKDMRVEVAGRVVKAIETTGAGDTFCGSSINYVLEHGLENLTEENLKEMLSFANAAAALITTKKGAIRSMPEKEDVLAFME